MFEEKAKEKRALMHHVEPSTPALVIGNTRLSSGMDNLFPYPKMGSSFLEILQDPLTSKLLGHEAVLDEDALPFVTGVATRLDFLLRNPTVHLSFSKIGYSSLEAFLQSNCTGPSLEFNSEEVIIPKPYRRDQATTVELKKQLKQSLAVDGAPVYSLIPNIELFWLAKVLLSNVTLAEEGYNGRRARFRVNFVHQKLLLEKSDSLREQVYSDGEVLGQQLSSRLKFGAAAAEEHYVEYLMESAATHTYYGDDNKARLKLAEAAKLRQFEFALTGALGKRTRYQEHDTSQLVILAKSRDHEPETYSSRKPSRADGSDLRKSSSAEASASPRPSTPATSGLTSVPTSAPRQPATVSLGEASKDDDTLLETIAFKKTDQSTSPLATVQEASSLPPSLASLDPADQPLLFPMDSIILLATASSISNTSPADGLTREETVPYATRVLDGGSSNWQVYSQALLVRSRIEGYRSRTAERGLLQLQALVDQIIAETTSADIPTRKDLEDGQNTTSAAHSFLPKLKPSESASPAERLKYIYQLSPPLRWELESELAARWIQLGGLKTALEIYERLQMHAEVALCLAGTDQEAHAVKLVRSLLFEPRAAHEDSAFSGAERAELPSEAARLFCILGDLEDAPEHYQRAWTLSKGRYARAQRSLGRYYTKRKQYKQAADAYEKGVSINRLNVSTWFALGGVQLELEDWSAAVDSFTRTIQLNSEDAEAWSNLAVALLRMPEAEEEEGEDTAPADGDEVDRNRRPATEDILEDEEDAELEPVMSKDYKTTRDALAALRRAAQLKRDDARIWDNYLTVAASLPPPWTPWTEILLAQKRVIELRGKTVGEKAVDDKIMALLVAYVTMEYEYPNTDAEDLDGREAATLRPGSLPRELIELVDKLVVPLITSSAELWLLVAKLARWRRRPLGALEAHEKAWRVVTAQPGVYERDEKGWDGVVAATRRLVRAYGELAEEERERTGGKVVDGDWRFKARSAVRGVLGKGRELWGETGGYAELEGMMRELKT